MRITKRGWVISIYDFKVKAQDSSEVFLEDYKGKVLLIVNTATGCGFTHQYDELQDLEEVENKLAGVLSKGEGYNGGFIRFSEMGKYLYLDSGTLTPTLKL